MTIPEPRQLPSGNWHIQLRLNGVSISITEPSRQQCVIKAAAYKSSLIDTGSGKVPRISLGVACDRYIEVRKGILSPTTIEGYEKIRNQHFQSIMGVLLTRLSDNVLNQAISAERNRPSRRGGTLSAKTIKSAVCFILSVLKENNVQPNRVIMPEVKRRIFRIPSPDDVIRAVVGTDIELPCLLAAWLSLSMSEIRGLTKSRSVYNHQLYILDTMVRVKRTDILKDGGKEENRTRVLDIPPYIESLINAVQSDTIVNLSPSQIEKKFSKILSASDLPHMTFHQLRHLNASTMAMLGIQKEVAQERGGWKTSYTMDTVYTHVFTQQRRAADRVIDNYFQDQIEQCRTTQNCSQNAHGPDRTAQKPNNIKQFQTDQQGFDSPRLHHN